MIKKSKITVGTLAKFLTYKLSADEANTTYRKGSLDAQVVSGEPDIMWQSVVFVKDAGMIWTMGAPFCYSLSSAQIDAIEALFADGTTGATLENLVERVVNLENATVEAKNVGIDAIDGMSGVTTVQGALEWLKENGGSGGGGGDVYWDD